jgi:RNA methyltransferase, TrmH family
VVKRAASLRQRKFRDREGAFLAEGVDIVAAGIACGHRPQIVFVQAEQAGDLAGRLGLDALPDPAPAVYPVIERVAAKISTLDTPPEVMAVFPLPPRPPLASLRGAAASPKTAALRRPAGAPPPVRSGALVVYVDGVQDPGNVGTLLRAAVAFGAAALVTSPTAADLYSPKTLRAGMGAVFGLPVVAGAVLTELLEALGETSVYGLVAHGGTPLSDAELRRPAVLVVGAERQGLSPAAEGLVGERLTIPIAPALPGVVESLNAGVAGAIALYEFSRRSAGASDDARAGSATPAKG